MEFNTETFHIARDVNLTADVCYFKGHPICKTKTIVLQYGKATYRAAEYGSTFANLLIKRAIEPAYVVELINYLCRIANGCNMFNIYATDVNDKEFDDLELYTFGNIEDIVQARARLNQNINNFDGYLKKRYNDCYDSIRRKFDKDELTQHLNPKFQYVNSDFNFDYIPIYGYVNATGNASKSATPYLHLAVVFNILAHQDVFSAINNQEAVASFNAIMKSKSRNVTAARVNESEFKRIIEENISLREECGKKQDKIDELTKKMNELIAKSDLQLEELHTANANIHQLQQTNDQQVEQLHQLQQTNDQQLVEIGKLQKQNTDTVELIKDVKIAICKTSQQYKSTLDTLIPDNAITTGTTYETMFVWYNKDFDEYARDMIHARHEANNKYDDIEADEVVLDVICCQSCDLEQQLKERYYENSDEIVFEGEINNSIDLFKHFNSHVPEAIAKCVSIKQRMFRKIVVKRDQFKALEEALTTYAGRNERTKKSLTDMIEAKHSVITEYVNDRITEIYDRQEQLIENVVNAVIDGVQQTLKQVLEQLHPEMKQFKFKNRFRDIEYRNNNPLVRYGTKGKDVYELTESDIKNGKFR